MTEEAAGFALWCPAYQVKNSFLSMFLLDECKYDPGDALGFKPVAFQRLGGGKGEGGGCVAAPGIHYRWWWVGGVQ